MNDSEQFGYDFAKGVLIYVGRLIILGICLMFVWHLVSGLLAIGTDDSDASGYRRSGMTVYKDYKTGVEYLAAPEGGITPRLPKP